MLADVGVDDDVGQPIHKSYQVLNLGVGHPNGLVSEQLSGLLNGQAH